MTPETAHEKWCREDAESEALEMKCDRRRADELEARWRGVITKPPPGTKADHYRHSEQNRRFNRQNNPAPG